MRSVSIPFLFAGFVGYAFAGLRHHHAHGHRHHLLMPPAQNMEPRDLAWNDAAKNQDDFVVESITRTSTTTVFGKCAPTSTIHSTFTLVKVKPEPTVHTPEPFQTQWLRVESHPEPTEAEDTTTVFETKTITKTATNTVTVTVHPESSPLPLQDTPAEDPSKAGKTIPLANTSPKSPKTEGKAIPAKAASPPSPKDNGGPIKAVVDLPGKVLPGSKPGNPAPADWTTTPPNGQFSTKGFGERTLSQGKGIHYHGNVGKPWGSNIIDVSPAEAHRYKYVTQLTGANKEPWTVVFWNKFGPDGKLTGWYGHSALTFTLAPGETRYIAFDEDSEGAWGAAPGDHLPTDQYGGYSCTWGEFTFGDGETNGWSGWDVSAIQAQAAGQRVHGMSICQANGKGCSIITPGAEKVVDAYIHSKKHLDGIGGAASPGPVRLKVVLDYRG
ncbi:hypothetical protein N7475_002720 [Penicillium sp. IBT 31633x]|nr:hypothetical protein N7475_002720 [Penicillium sp. IBT 31633x]